ncbi:MAG TPA: hypothetical protein VFJ77_02325 [Gaiellaceae bacterium]|nr:hypothetical protein [Gaiellaceae bacterium]
MKTLLLLLVAVVALAAASTTLAATHQRPGPGLAKAKLALAAQRARILARCAKVEAANAGPQREHRCSRLGERLPVLLQRLERGLQARIAKLRQACPAGATGRRCDKAAERLAFLQKLEQRLQAALAKLQQLQAPTAGA